ncbi:hypothetical protein SAMN05444004_11596, partial [Jannaschia faecimaris]
TAKPSHNPNNKMSQTLPWIGQPTGPKSLTTDSTALAAISLNLGPRPAAPLTIDVTAEGARLIVRRAASISEIAAVLRRRALSST